MSSLASASAIRALKLMGCVLEQEILGFASLHDASVSHSGQRDRAVVHAPAHERKTQRIPPPLPNSCQRVRTGPRKGVKTIVHGPACAALHPPTKSGAERSRYSRKKVIASTALCGNLPLLFVAQLLARPSNGFSTLEDNVFAFANDERIMRRGDDDFALANHNLQPIVLRFVLHRKLGASYLDDCPAGFESEH